uniref:SAM domain-containing protein n=1 Tax=Setaria digitata TaxID=48799 RepID=A0A915PZ48_9BILA
MNLVSIEQFLVACESWNLEEVHQAVESGFLVDAFDDDHVTGLQMAAATGNIGIANRGADIEKTNQVGMTALHHAARNGHANIVRILVQRGANYHKLTYLGASAMTLAAGSGYTEVVKLLLDLRVNINPPHTALCPTPVIAAAFRRHTHLCALLSHRGAYLDGNIQRLSNLSALSTAISCGATTVVGALLELGADPTFRSLNGMTSVELAQHLQRNEMLAVMNSAIRSTLKEEEPMEADLRQLIYGNDENAIRLILHRHLPYVPLPENTTPLMYAVLLADINIVRLIQESNVMDINAAENVCGLTALMFAAIIGNYEVIEYLVSRGADISLMSFDGFTAIDYAFATGNINANLLCFLQQRLGNGTNQLSQRTDTHQHQHLSRVIHNSKTKILNKISSHVGLSSNAGSGADNKEKPNFSKTHLAKLVQIHQHDDEEFILANDILKSVGNEKIGKKDDLHRYIEAARFVAENCASQGIINLPVVFALNKTDSEMSNSIKYGQSLENSISTVMPINHKHRNFLSTAQMNAYLYYEYRFRNRSTGGTFLNASRTRHLYDDNDSQKINHSSSMLSRQYASLEYGSTHTLGTIPRYRSRSRETIKRNNIDDDDGRNSPSRSSLNQYIFSDKDGERLKKSTSTPTLDALVRRCSFNDNNGVDKMKRKLNLIWEKLSEAGLGRYISLLKDEEVDKGTFLALTNDDLVDIGISDAIHRKALLRIAKTLRY